VAPKHEPLGGQACVSAVQALEGRQAFTPETTSPKVAMMDTSMNDPVEAGMEKVVTAAAG
jgi:hypothetical protein